MLDDVDNDGSRDFLVGNADSGMNDQFLIDLQGKSGILADAAVTTFIFRDDRADGLVPAVHNGDLDGDGFEDMAFGATSLDSPTASSTGGVRLLFGYPILK